MVVAVVAAGALALLGPPAALPGSAATAPAKVTVTMRDYTYALSTKTVRRGAVVFSVVNKGKVVHDFKIAGKKTPAYEAGAGGVLKVTFKRAGRYPYVCTIPGHALVGMKGVLKVA